MHAGPCKVRNETETKRNETKQIETKRNKSKRNETDRNETKQIETKRNKTKRNKSKRNKTNDMASHSGQKSFFSNIRNSFLWRQHSGAPLRDHFVRRPSVCLSVRPSVCLSVRLSHFWFAYNFFTFRGRAFIFGMCVPYDNTFPMVT